MHTIYFAASIRGGREDKRIYNSLIEHLRTYGKVLTEHVADSSISPRADKGLSERAIHKRDMAWLHQSNVIVAEVSTPSLGTGYEIGRIAERNTFVAEFARKPILCLYRQSMQVAGRNLSAMIKGCSELRNSEYSTIEEAKNKIDRFFASKFCKS